MKYIISLSTVVFLLLCQQVCSVLASAPKTAKIAFSSNRDGNAEIYLMNPDGSDQVKLTKHPADDIHPRWSPTGEEILFRSNRDGKFDLYIMDSNGKNPRAVFEVNESRRSPVWSPDRKHIAYSSGADIYIATRDGENIKKVGQGQNVDWMSNGDWIVFISHPPMQIWLFNSRTLAREKIYQIHMGKLEDISWSPDGEQLAFSGLDRAFLQRRTIYILNRDGTAVERVLKTVLPFWAAHVVWSPQGDKLLYDRRTLGQSQIFKINVSGGRKEQLTQGIHSNFGADWFDPAVLSIQSQTELLTTLWAELKEE
ncbi:MAG: hypothetical protein OXI61_10365 [Candidatus Poribacteria bacterium]|nr:hypothetical protein [Candidatus Poribacteria bacterium]